MAQYFTNDRVLECLEGRPIGGGVGHHADIGLADADVTVETRSAFFDALNSSADVIGIPGTARIDLSGEDLTLSGQTIVSDRGIDGSPGALLYTTDHGHDSPAWDGGSNGRGLITMDGGSRLSGVRLRGPYHDYYDDPEYPGYIPLDSGNTSERRQAREGRYARGLRILADDVEVDNCEIYGWPNQAIAIGTSSNAVSPSIHHIYGHDCMMVGAGYVIDVFNGHPTIEMSYFNATRHAIAGFGHPTCGYTLEDSVFGPTTYSHAVDMHCLAENGYGDDLTAGGRVEVRRCTFAFTHSIRDYDCQAIAFRGYPDDVYITENNRFLHDVDPDFENPANTSGQPVPYRQVNVGSGWHDWQSSGNQYGVGEPQESGIGAPVNLDDPMAGKPLIDEERRRGLRVALRTLE
ncbi:hypothetical protein [Halalkalicoccus subterraneus]|uniref:hypothetical protein n=1 Tax=Halalkalicoccus subterraneus TaxID=2675002 RepID=UPI000EFBF13F|nr:hypothetical protein [Halalkalicoccus subterraneus]